VTPTATATREPRRQSAAAPAGPEVDPRIQARRDEVDHARLRRRRRWWFGLLGGLTLLLALWWALRGPLLSVRRVQAAPTAHLSAADLRAAAGIASGDRLLGLDTGAAARRLEALPWVDRAHVTTSWRGTVHISVTERHPVFLVANRAGQPWILADATGRALGLSTAAPPGLLIVAGPAPVGPGHQLGAAFTGVRQLEPLLTAGLRSRVIAVLVAADGSMQLQLQPSGTAELCQPTGLSWKLADLTTFFAHVDDRGLLSANACTKGSVFATHTP
jgi:cell division protein FtsQ